MRNPKCIVLQPTHSLSEAEHEFEGKYVSTADYGTSVEQDSIGILANGEPKFVFLRNYFSSPQRLQDIYKSLRTLRFNSVQSSLRKRALQGSKGGEVVLGWLDDSRTGPRRAANTMLFPAYGFVVVPMLAYFAEVLRNYLPNYCREQAAAAAGNGIRLVGGELKSLIEAKGVSIIHANGARRPFSERDFPQPLYSTVAINRNAFFRSHADAKNQPGFSCITTFGDFTGGELCFPRLRVTLPLKPGDILIADTNREQHGNVGALDGDRISVVAYLRTMKQRSGV